jgi:hypothetical protein
MHHSTEAIVAIKHGSNTEPKTQGRTTEPNEIRLPAMPKEEASPMRPIEEFRSLFGILGVSQSAASKLLGCTREHLNTILNGHREPSETLLIALRLTVEVKRIKQLQPGESLEPLTDRLLWNFDNTIRRKLIEIFEVLSRESKAVQKTFCVIIGLTLKSLGRHPRKN